MSYLNIESQKTRTYDAIVIGSGISGGWSAKELTGKGLKTLVLERGRDVKHLVDYPTTLTQPWEFAHHGQLSKEVKDANPIISKCYAFYEGSEHNFVKDAQQPYIQEKPFDWIRGYQVGGKSLMWARQTQRWSQYDFEGPARDGFATPWPIGYKDLAPWYSKVEKFAGIAGNKDGLDMLPDGEFLPGYELGCLENHFKDEIKKAYGSDRHLISARCAHLSQPKAIHLAQGRGQCQARTICERGCPYGGYFASNSSTLPWAAKTGKMTLRPNSVVHSILYDETKKRAIGVKVIDALTKAEIDYYAKIIFVNAAAINSTALLLNSTSNRFPNGLGNDSETLGKYVAFHLYRARINAEYEGLKEFTMEGKKPTAGYIPRFRNLYKQETDFLRGYAAGVYTDRKVERSYAGMGEELKTNLETSKYGNWSINSHIMGETIPKASNTVTLDKSIIDPYGLPTIKFNIDYDDNDEKMIKDYLQEFKYMFEKAGYTNINLIDTKQAPGLDIHEMGGARMGKDPKTSMVNGWNQLHACKNVFVTDGACMTSTSTQNPSLTFMAFSARAVDYAVKQVNAKKL